MYLFRRPDYQSDTTKFINNLKKQRPELDEQQRAGRALLWDKELDRDLLAEYKAGRIKQKPYVYQTDAE